MNKTQILAVDDEPQIRKLLQIGLSSYGYIVLLVSNGQDALTTASREQPDIIVLDINLGSTPDGLDICRKLREWSTTPIIMLTVNEDKSTKLAALNAGADDYIVKPFDMEELEARIRAVLRRSVLEKSHSTTGEIRVHDLIVDLVKRRVMLKGEEIHLTPTEYKLLVALATHPGKVLTLSTLVLEIQGAAESPKSEHYLRVYINTLRKKLQDDLVNTTRPLYINNEPGVGYRFTDLQSGE
ncbi:MAG: response regulator transcription factor [Chloroflexota bacterium]